jgi:hypothetical protein
VTPSSPVSSNPGPAWAWFAAWSVQGAVAGALEAGGLAPGALRFALMGALTGLPLLVLYLWLRRRGDG